MTFDEFTSLANCPECHGIDTCFAAPDGKHLYCMRGMEPAEHIMPGTSGMAKPDLPMMKNRYIANMTTQRILAICAELGCSEAVAKAYGAGYCPIASRDYFEDAFTFPVYDPRGWSIEAIAAHKPGQGWGWVQRRVGMFRDCLFGPVDDPISGKEKAPKLVVIPRGIANTMAAASLGLTAVGRTCAEGSWLGITRLMKRCPLDAVLCPDRDGGWVEYDGKRVLPGAEGTLDCVQNLLHDFAAAAAGDVTGQVRQEASRLRVMKLPTDCVNIVEFVRKHSEDTVMETIQEAPTVDAAWLANARSLMDRMRRAQP